MNRKNIYLYFLLFLLLTSSCNLSTTYPNELVEVDSMLMRSDYKKADSILNSIDISTTSINQHSKKYEQLLRSVRLFVSSELSPDDFAIADELDRFYKEQDTREYIMSKLITSELYRMNGDYPSAMGTILLAVQSEALMQCATLYIWVNRMIGDIYFEQRMFPECIQFYQKSFAKAIERNDTLRMAHGAFSMAQVCIINNKVDSAIYYLNKSIEWSHYQAEGKLTQKPAQSVLADIYIQTEQFDKATSFLTRDTIDDVNWAYWHLGQNHTDSAIYYFKKMIGVYGWESDCAFFEVLTQLEQQKGHLQQALIYSRKLNDAKDSLEIHSQVENIRKTREKCEFEKVKNERDTAEDRSKKLFILSTSLIVFVLVIAIMVIVAWRAYRSKKENELLQKKLLLKEERQKHKQSKEQILANEEQIAKLKKSLQQAKKENDVATMKHLLSEEKLLETENDNIRAKREHTQLMQRELEQSALCKRIKLNAGKDTFHLNNDEWYELATLIDNAYDQFTIRLRSLCDNISIYELQICYLIKIDMGPTDIGMMLYKSKAAIGMARQRLYYKLTGSKGKAQQLDELIRKF